MITFGILNVKPANSSKEINEACKSSTSKYVELEPPDTLTFRSIVAGPTCKTHWLRNFYDMLLKKKKKKKK